LRPIAFVDSHSTRECALLSSFECKRLRLTLDDDDGARGPNGIYGGFKRDLRSNVNGGTATPPVDERKGDGG
jgi:hypothetical protein